MEEEKAARGAEFQRKDFILEVPSRAIAIGRQLEEGRVLHLALFHPAHCNTHRHTPLCAY